MLVPGSVGFTSASSSPREARAHLQESDSDIDIVFGTGELKGPLHVDTYRVGGDRVRPAGSVGSFGGRLRPNDCVLATGAFHVPSW